MRAFLLIVMCATASVAAPNDLQGLWHGSFTASGGEKRALDLALKIQGDQVTGEVETPTRNAPLVDGKLQQDGFSAIAQSDWDGKLARRPIEGRLAGSTLNVRVQAWPDGPMVDYKLEKVSGATAIPKPKPLPVPAVKDVPWNGLAKTPPMGWNSWNRFGCKIDEKMIREMADALVSTGLRDAGYVYLNIDDCWQGERDGKGNIQSHPTRFPDMKKVVDYVHSKGLKIGIYSSPGPRTCAGYEGSYGHEEQDARTYAAWGFDYLKYDWCSAGKLYGHEEMRPVLQKMGAALRATKRPMVYSISQYGLANVWEWAPKTGANLWRTTGDIGANWNSVSEIGFNQFRYAKFARPGHWNDPDMLEVGNGDFTVDEYRAHMSMWAMLAAPLLAGNDLRTMKPEVRDILTNRDVIAIDQDPLGKQATTVSKEQSYEIWTKPMSDGSTVVGVFNREAAKRTVELPWKTVGLARQPKRVRDVWKAADLKLPNGGNGTTVALESHGVMLFRVWN